MKIAAKIVFTPQLERFITCPSQVVSGKTVAKALEEVFARNHELRGYIINEQGNWRGHIAVFVDNHLIKDLTQLSDKVYHHNNF